MPSGLAAVAGTGGGGGAGGGDRGGGTVSYRSIKTENKSKNKSEDVSKNMKEDVGKKEGRDEGEKQDGGASVPASLPLNNSSTVAAAVTPAATAVANVQDSKASTSYSSTGQDTRISLIQVHSLSRTPIHSLIFLVISLQSHVASIHSHVVTSYIYQSF